MSSVVSGLLHTLQSISSWTIWPCFYVSSSYSTFEQRRHRWWHDRLWRSTGFSKGNWSLIFSVHFHNHQICCSLEQIKCFCFGTSSDCLLYELLQSNASQIPCLTSKSKPDWSQWEFLFIHGPSAQSRSCYKRPPSPLCVGLWFYFQVLCISQLESTWIVLKLVPPPSLFLLHQSLQTGLNSGALDLMNRKIYCHCQSIFLDYSNISFKSLWRAINRCNPTRANTFPSFAKLPSCLLFGL